MSVKLSRNAHAERWTDNVQLSIRDAIWTPPPRIVRKNLGKNVQTRRCGEDIFINLAKRNMNRMLYIARQLELRQK